MANISKVQLPNGSIYDLKDANAIHSSEKGVAGGVAELDSTGRVPSGQLPAFVDDVIEGYYYEGKFYADAEHTIEIEGESGKIYVDLDTNKVYRWSGSVFVEISSSLALGETSTTAYRGDRGKAAYDHSQLTSGNPHNVTASDVGVAANPTLSGEETTLTSLTVGGVDYKINTPASDALITIYEDDWVGSGPYTQAVTVSGVKATEIPFVIAYQPDDSQVSANDYNFYFDLIDSCTITADTLTFTCNHDKPSINLQALVKRG